MSDDADHLLLTLPRGPKGEIQISRSRYEGHTFTRLQVWFPDPNGELRPGRQCVTIRDHELGDVITALSRVARHVERSGGVTRAEPRRQSATVSEPKTGDLTTDDRSTDMEAF